MATEPEQPRPTISTHVLDTERGVPAAGVHVTLYRIVDGKQPVRMTQALTDSDGRVRDLLERPLVAGDYRIEFSLAAAIGGPAMPRRRRLLPAPGGGPADLGRGPQLPCATAAVVVRADHLPGQLTARPPRPLGSAQDDEPVDVEARVTGGAGEDDLERVRPVGGPAASEHDVPAGRRRAVQAHGPDIRSVDVDLGTAAGDALRRDRWRPHGR